jgi:hypothetical protein
MKFHGMPHYTRPSSTTWCGLKSRDELFDYENEFCRKCFSYKNVSDFCVHKHEKEWCNICFEEVHEGIIFEWKLFNFKYELSKFDESKIRLIIKSDFIIVPTSNKDVRITMISRGDPLHLDIETARAMARHGNIKLNAVSGIIFTEVSE